MTPLDFKARSKLDSIRSYRDCHLPDHVFRVDTPQLLDLLKSAYPALANAIAEQQKQKRDKLGPVYVARYKFGQKIVSTHSDGLRRLQPPCQSPNCEGCTELADQCRDETPLCMSLDKKIEGYSSDNYATGGDRCTVPRWVKGPGAPFGILGSLHVLDPHTGKPMQTPGFRCDVAAGIRTVMCDIPLGNWKLSSEVLHHEGGKATNDQIMQTQKEFGQDGRRFMLKVIEAANRGPAEAARALTWTVDVLIIPAKSIGVDDRRVQPLINFLQAEALRKFAELVLADTEVQVAYLLKKDEMQSVRATVPVVRSFSHLLCILNGSRPGFRPVRDDSGGPFLAVQAYLGTSGLKNAPGLDGKFLSLLEPAQSRDCHGLLYSFQKQTVPGPIERQGTMTTWLDEAHQFLQSCKNYEPDLLPAGLQWTLFCDKPGATQPGSGGMPIVHPKNDQEFISDFAPQREIARTLWEIEDIDEFFPNSRTGFMAGFIRFRLPRVQAKGSGTSNVPNNGAPSKRTEWP